MPISREHAFGQGYTARVGKLSAKRKLTERRQKLVRELREAIRDQQIEEVLETFRSGSAAHESVRVGLSAWCVNHGSKESISLGANVICRGLLRLENFRAAKLIIEEDVYIGDDSIISCAHRIEIGRLTMIAHGVQIFDNDSHPLDPDEREKDYLTVLGKLPGPRPNIASAPIAIGPRVWIGMGCMVMKGVTIGEGSVVAAGSVVTNCIPPYSIAAGVPARVVSRISPSADFEIGCSTES